MLSLCVIMLEDEIFFLFVDYYYYYFGEKMKIFFENRINCIFFILL